MTRLAAVELGGTNALLALAEDGRVVDRRALAVGAPGATLGAIAGELRRWNGEGAIEALGIASFGPIRVDRQAPDHGRMLATPKPGWSDADVLGSLAAAVAGPAVIHTDVTAAALAEGQAGAARGCSDHVYMTVGTGVGIGVIAGGRPVVGAMHPEGGHLPVRRQSGDGFAGACPFHGDCLEGLVSGPALAARCGGDPAVLGDDHPVWTPVADALAEACAILFTLLATQRIVIGGGVVRHRPWLIPAVAKRCGERLGVYLRFFAEDHLCAPHFPDAGLRGALLLAEQAI